MKSLLQKQFGFPVRIYRSLRVLLRNRRLLRSSIGCASRGEYELPNTGLNRCAQQCKRMAHVVSEILSRVAHRLAHVGARSEMNDASNPVPLDQPLNERLILDIAL